MKSRITYILPEGTGINPKTIEVNQNSVVFPKAADAALEKKVTVGLSELPEEVSAIFEELDELHMRWASRVNYHSLSPLTSRLPPGLHVFIKPRAAEQAGSICRALAKSIDWRLKCHSVAESFSSPSAFSQALSSASTFQWYQELEQILRFQLFLVRDVCQRNPECISEVALLANASYFDIDFDAGTNSVTFTALWSPTRHSTDGVQPVEKHRPDDRVEVGILQEESTAEVAELKLGGYLTVIGEDKKPSPTLFSFPARHQTLRATVGSNFEAKFQTPTGLHPKLDIIIPRRSLVPPTSNCALHAYLTLPSAIFIDRYQFSDQLFLSSQNLVDLRSFSGEDDLEAPEWVVKRWGSAALFELALPSEIESEDDNWTASIPMHLRYLSSEGGVNVTDYKPQLVPWPAVFWACDAEESLEWSTNPFDRTNLGYDALFPADTIFYHVSPENPDTFAPASNISTLFETLRVPTLDQKQTNSIEVGTFITVLMGFAWACWQLFKPLRKNVKRVIKPSKDDMEKWRAAQKDR